MPPKRGTRGGIEAEKIQLARVKSREKRRAFNFVLDGEVVNRCKNIGKKWQGRVLRQKLEKRAKQLIQRRITRTRWWKSFSENLISIKKEEVSEDGQQTQVKQRQIKYFFPTPRGLKTASGGARDTELQDHYHRQGQDSGKNIKAIKEDGREKTEQAGGGDRLG